MTPGQRRTVLVGIALEFIATLIPSWTRTEALDVGGSTVLVIQSARFAPLFQPPTRGLSQTIDFGRLGLFWLLIALGCAFAWIWQGRRTRAAG